MSLPPDIPPEAVSRTGLSFMLDTNAIGNPDPTTAALLDELHSLHLDGSINLFRSDTVDTELADAPDDRRARLRGLASAYAQYAGPRVRGHSTHGYTVRGSEQDAERIDLVFGILYPNADRQTSGNHVRDAMHVSTAIRYGTTGLVTSDKRVLRKAVAIQQAFDGFKLLDPAAALKLSRRFVRKGEELARRLAERAETRSS